MPLAYPFIFSNWRTNPKLEPNPVVLSRTFLTECLFQYLKSAHPSCFRLRSSADTTEALIVCTVPVHKCCSACLSPSRCKLVHVCTRIRLHRPTCLLEQSFLLKQWAEGERDRIVSYRGQRSRLCVSHVGLCNSCAHFYSIGIN